MSQAFRHQHGKARALQFGGSIAEDFFRRAIGKENRAIRINRYNGIRSHLSHYAMMGFTLMQFFCNFLVGDAIARPNFSLRHLVFSGRAR